MLDAILSGTSYSADGVDIGSIIEGHGKESFGDLAGAAIAALEKVVGEGSELNELWSENEDEYESWKQNIISLMGRLQ